MHGHIALAFLKIHLFSSYFSRGQVFKIIAHATIYDYRSDDGETPQGSPRVLQTPWPRVGLRKDRLPLTSLDLSSLQGWERVETKSAVPWVPSWHFVPQATLYLPENILREEHSVRSKLTLTVYLSSQFLTANHQPSKEDSWQGRKSTFTPDSHIQPVLKFASVAKTGSWEMG